MIFISFQSAVRTLVARACAPATTGTVQNRSSWLSYANHSERLWHGCYGAQHNLATSSGVGASGRPLCSHCVHSGGTAQQCCIQGVQTKPRVPPRKLEGSAGVAGSREHQSDAQRQAPEFGLYSRFGVRTYRLSLVSPSRFVSCFLQFKAELLPAEKS